MPYSSTLRRLLRWAPLAMLATIPAVRAAPIDNQAEPAVAQHGVSTQQWVLKQGSSIADSLTAWGTAAGWAVVWKLKQDWSVPQTASFSGSFLDAVRQVAQSMAADGADVHVTAFSGNHTLVLTGAGTDHAE